MLVFIIPLFVCVSVVMGEPQCSQYHFVEKVLEKVIDVQYRFDMYAKNMEKWEKVMAKQIERFDEIAKQLHHEDKARRLAVDKMRTDVNGTLVTFLKSADDIKEHLTEASKVPLVLFKARSVKNRAVTPGETIVYTIVVQNEGDGYNKETGIFTAPVSGTYLFTAQFCLYGGQRISVTILVNGTPITVAYFGDSSWTTCYTTDGVSHLTKGDTVKVATTTYTSYSGNIIDNDDTGRWTYFSGVLLLN